MQRRQRRLGVVQHHGLGDLQLEPPGGSRGIVQRRGRPTATRLRLLNCTADRLTATRSVARPGRSRAGRPARSTHSPIGTIRPISSASGMNCAGRDHAALRMPPAQQRLERRSPRRRADRPAADRTLRADRSAVPGADRVPAAAAPASRHPSRPGTADRRRDRRTWRDTTPGRRSFSSSIGIQAILRRERDADAGADDDLMAVDLERIAQQLDQTVGEARWPRSACRSPSARWRIHRRQAAPRCRSRAIRSREPLSHRLQQGIADRMSQRVVHRLELIEVEAQQRQDPAAPRKGQRLLQLRHGTAPGSAGRSARRGAPDEPSWLRPRADSVTSSKVASQPSSIG